MRTADPEMRIEGPDEVIVMSAERFIETVRQQFANMPFVAVNTTRSCTSDSESREFGPRGLVGLVAVGFETEYTDMFPAVMSAITNEGNMQIITDEAPVASMLRENLTPDEEDIPVKVAVAKNEESALEF
jgi:hypothetical protein